MYNTGGTQSICQPTFIDYDITTRLGWLKTEVERTAQRKQLAQREHEEKQAMAMLNPFTMRESLSRLGMFLGLFPPAAIFYRMFGDEFYEQRGAAILVVCILMTVICCLVGRAFGGALGGAFTDTRHRSWLATLFALFGLGILWGGVTGAAGGAVFFIIGGVFGAFFAMPIGAVSFAAFAALHRLLSRNGMIEKQQLWPIAFGIPCIVAAAILGWT